MKVLLLYERATPPKRMAIAVRLDKDMVAQGEDVRHVFERLFKQMCAYEGMREQGNPQTLKPAPLEYHAIYAMSAPYDGVAPFGWDVRVWYGESPAQWRFAQQSRGRK